MKSNCFRYLSAGVVCILLYCCTEKSYTSIPQDNPGKTYILKTDSGFQLIRNNAPYHIRGVCAADSMNLLPRIGVNSIRTYTTDDAGTLLDQAQTLNLSVTLTILLDHVRNFDYSDTLATNNKMKWIEKIVDQYKNHPALLVWCIGNEFQWDENPDIQAYTFLNEVSRMIHRKDPNHPTTTSVPGYPRIHLPVITAICPDLDFISFNKFGQIHSIQEKMNQPIWGYDGPVLITEFGNYGYWDPYLKRAWNMTVEPSDSVKADRITGLFKKMKNDPRILGSYLFYFGHKQEYTPTWFSLMGSNGEKTRMLESIMENWEQEPFENQVPRIQKYHFKGTQPDSEVLFNKGKTGIAEFVLSDPENDSLQIEFEILPESRIIKDLYDHEIKPMPIPSEFTITNGQVRFTIPNREGPLRLFLYVRDGNGNIASANLPFYVQ